METHHKFRVAVVGASGYSGEELVGLLLGHPAAELTAVTSRQYAGQPLAALFPRCSGRTALCFEDPDPASISGRVDAAFLALPHGVAAEQARVLLAHGARVFDLSADFRLRSTAVYRQYYGAEHPAPELLAQAVYGLVERYRESLREARLVACPGCYPTSAILAAAPALAAGLVDTEPVVINSLSGVSGAGRKVALEYIFPECHDSLRAYGVPAHRHLPEIEQELSLAAGPSAAVRASFTPHLVPVNRGIVTSIVLRLRDAGPDAEKAVADAYGGAYAGEPFVRWLGSGRLPDTKFVLYTNICEVAARVDARTGLLWVGSAIDNLVKGAAGQAVQAFNVVFGLPETAGLAPAR